MKTVQSTPVFVPAKSPFRWVMLGLVWSLYFCFGITSGTIAPLVEPIRQEFGMNYSQMGLVLGAWQLVYIAAASPLGAMIDRLGIRRSLLIGIVLVWLSLVLRGLSVDFVTLFLAVALFGIGGPIISIGAPKVVSVWFEGNERGVASGIYTTGPVGGVAVALATAGSVVLPLTGTWRGVSLVYGAVVLVALVAWWALARDVPASLAAGVELEASRKTPVWVVLRELLGLRNVRLLLVLAIGTFMLNHGLNNWLPTLLREGGMSLSQAGLWTAAATAVGAGGVLVIPGLARRGYRTLALGLLLAAAAATTLGLALLEGSSQISVLLASAIARAPLMPMLTLVLMETPGVGSQRMGSAGGLFFAAAEVGGFSGPFLLGFLRDVSGSLIAGVLFLAAVSSALILTMPFLQEHREERAMATPGGKKREG